MKQYIHTFRSAFQDVRRNLLHTLLSVLGIVIGVAALVSILSLIDGMEQYAHDQISKTTTLESVMIQTSTTRRIDNVLVNKEEYAYFNYPIFNELMKDFPEAKGYLKYQESGFIAVNDTSKRGVLLSGIVDTWNDQLTQVAGRFVSKADIDDQAYHAVLTLELAAALNSERPTEDWLDESIEFKGVEYTVIGVIDTPSENLELFVPISVITEETLKARPPQAIILASSIEEVPVIKAKCEAFFAKQFGPLASDLTVLTNEFRVAQANQGFLVFRLVMGLIVGISVLVGGIGVMNVLLISVTERTAEIGVRKAVGAKRKDIVMQFLSESLSISFIGSILGLTLGILFTLVAVPIVKHLTKMPFEAAYTVDTLIVIALVSVFVGIVFGTYPALKASKLDPVEAIRRE